MKYIEVYNDAACKNLFAAIPCQTLDYGGITGTAKPVNMGGHLYSCLGYISGNFFSFSAPDTTGIVPAFLSTKNRFPSGKTFYTKSGFNFAITETSGNYQTCSVRDLKYNNTQVANNLGAQVQPNTTCALYFVEVHAFDTTYYGLTAFQRSDSTSEIFAAFLTTGDFWETSFRPDYAYGAEPDNGGGQATGTMPNTGVHRSQNPTGGIPVGGRGLHTYIISPTGYSSLQNYLWGEGDTLAKSLWQKFLNKTHNPANCVIACFRLPSAFMPTGGSSSGVQLAGVNLPVTGAASFDAFSSHYTEYTVSLGTPIPPFDSWLDYSGVTCKIGVPFCGEIAVPAEKVYDKEVTIKYRCDWFNGNLGAAVYAGNTIIADLTGNCAYNIPVSGGDTGTLDRIGALAVGALQIAAAETGAAAVAGVATAAAGVAGSQFKTYLNNSNISGSVNSTMNGVAYIEFIIPTTAYSKYQNVATYIQAFGLPAPAASGSLSAFAGGYGEFDVCRTADGLYIPNATDAEKEEIIRLLKEGVIV